MICLTTITSFWQYLCIFLLELRNSFATVDSIYTDKLTMSETMVACLCNVSYTRTSNDARVYEYTSKSRYLCVGVHSNFNVLIADNLFMSGWSNATTASATVGRDGRLSVAKDWQCTAAINMASFLAYLLSTPKGKFFCDTACSLCQLYFTSKMVAE